MSFNARVYARDASGKLVKFDADGVDSYAQAIQMVKDEIKAPRALALVAGVLKAEIPPYEKREVA